MSKSSTVWDKLVYAVNRIRAGDKSQLETLLARIEVEIQQVLLSLSIVDDEYLEGLGISPERLQYMPDVVPKDRRKSSSGARVFRQIDWMVQRITEFRTLALQKPEFAVRWELIRISVQRHNRRHDLLRRVSVGSVLGVDLPRLPDVPRL